MPPKKIKLCQYTYRDGKICDAENCKKHNKTILKKNKETLKKKEKLKKKEEGEKKEEALKIKLPPPPVPAKVKTEILIDTIQDRAFEELLNNTIPVSIEEVDMKNEKKVSEKVVEKTDESKVKQNKGFFENVANIVSGWFLNKNI